MSMKNFSAGERLFAADLNDNFTETTKAGNVTSGTFNAARIPGLDASKIVSGKIAQARLPMKRVARFTGSGTWTVPAGVTYAIAHMLGGGGGIGTGFSGGDGTASSVAFASGTVSSLGGHRGVSGQDANPSGAQVQAGQANSGQGARRARAGTDDGWGRGGFGGQSQWIVAGAAVTPAANITVTVGNGGSAGTAGAAGGSGYVWIEYYE